MDILEAINQRHMCRNFDPEKKVQSELIEKLIDAGRKAPSAGGLQDQVFTIVEDSRKMEDIRKISDLTQEYDVEIYDVIVETFQDDKKTKKVLIETLGKIKDIFNQYEKWKETDFAVF